MLNGKDDDHKPSTCDPKGANIDAQKHHFRSSDYRKSGQRLAEHCRYTRVYLLTADAEADGLFTMSESFQNIRIYLADVIPASRSYSRLRSSTPAG